MNSGVIPLGLEPKTHSLEGCCSIQLSYGTVLPSIGAANILLFHEITTSTLPLTRNQLMLPFYEKTPNIAKMSGVSKNGSYLLSQLVGQYHRRW